MAPWLHLVETFLVQQLLRIPAFHRGVEKVARTVHRLRHGTPPDEMGGTRLDQPANGSFLRHFTEEIQTQLGRAEARSGEAGLKSKDVAAKKGTQGRPQEQSKMTEDESADAVWRNAQQSSGQGPEPGFLGEYAKALREQLRNVK